MSEQKSDMKKSPDNVLPGDGDKWKSIREYIKEHLEVVTIIGVLVSGIFNFGSYVYSMGIYDFWNIPYLYITNNTENILFKFVLSVGIGIVLFTVSTAFVLAIKEETEGKRSWSRRKVYAVYFLKVFAVVVVLWFLALWAMSSLFEAFLYLVYYPVTFFMQSLSLCFTTYICFWGLGISGCMVVFPNKIRFLKIEGSGNRFLMYAISVVIVIFSTAWMLYTVYDCGRTSAEGEKKITVATIQENEYVVINRYEETWIVKECICGESGWKINQSHYGFENLEGIPLQVRNIGSNDSLSNYLTDIDCELSTDNIEEETVEEIVMLNFSMWCNQNEGFVSAILTVVALLLSVLTMFMTYRLGTMPYKKRLSFVPVFNKRDGEAFIDLTVINCGNATICIQSLDISNNEKLHIGKAEDLEYVTLKPCDYIQKSIRLCDDLENIEKKQSNLNGYIVITAHDVDGKQYKVDKGFPVG